MASLWMPLYPFLWEIYIYFQEEVHFAYANWAINFNIIVMIQTLQALWELLFGIPKSDPTQALAHYHLLRPLNKVWIDKRDFISYNTIFWVIQQMSIKPPSLLYNSNNQPFLNFFSSAFMKKGGNFSQWWNPYSLFLFL